MTHFDPRSVAASVAISVAVALLLQGVTDPNEITLKATEIALDSLNEDDNESSDEEASPNAIETLPGGEGAKNPGTRQMGHFKSETARGDFIRHLQAKSLKELELDDRFAQGFAFKLLGTSLSSSSLIRLLGESLWWTYLNAKDRRFGLYVMARDSCKTSCPW